MLISKIEKVNSDSIFIDKDLYWNINGEELYNVYDEPKNMSIGSIKDDWDFLEKILTNKRDITNYDFNKISSILKLFSEY